MSAELPDLEELRLAASLADAAGKEPLAALAMAIAVHIAKMHPVDGVSAIVETASEHALSKLARRVVATRIALELHHMIEENHDNGTPAR